MNRSSVLAWLAMLSFVVAVTGFGLALDDYAQLRDPVALLGARGMPHAWVFNLLGFVLPGLLVAIVGIRLRRELPAASAWPARIGAQLCVLAALAFAAQGLVSLDASDLDASRTRLHALLAMLWWLAFVPGALLLALGLRQVPGRRALAWVGVLVALALLWFVASPWQPLSNAVAQRIAFVAWLGWAVVAARRPG
ncbi:putative membrane protein [Luteimonas cucumeris]|uniref:Putative membrane protein n=1 Tax=Luteimonas cucumeris TaxID=985012 RepID=A0A562LBG6_9GAMM|nr:DUF998 domain-containing protein [Luteimonas cucumeris]TWI04958.1 putative membrane protein [Luteimonas cucumeris]